MSVDPREAVTLYLPCTLYLSSMDDWDASPLAYPRIKVVFTADQGIGGKIGNFLTRQPPPRDAKKAAATQCLLRVGQCDPPVGLLCPRAHLPSPGHRLPTQQPGTL